MSAAEFLDGLAAARAAGTRHAHEPECCEPCEAGERFHAGAVCAGAGCDPLLQCLRCRMPLPNHMPHDADCDAVLTLTAPALADAWDEGFEAAAEWAARNPGPSGITSDPPLNPYEIGQVVP